MGSLKFCEPLLAGGPWFANQSIIDGAIQEQATFTL
jgi:hypothetical protein